jgi:DNA-binding transcriptional LysR family regulator
MELLQLKYFCQAAECENFSEVARKNGVPPSDISQSIKRLEGELSVELFIRQANRIRLSAEGKTFYMGARRTLEELENAILQVTDSYDKGKIKICINSNRRIVMQAIDRYRRTYPEVEIETFHFAEPTSERFDIVIDCEKDGISDYFDRTLLVTEDILLAVSADSPHAKKKEISLSDFRDEPFITLGDASSMSKMLNSLCEKHGFRPHIAIKSDDPFYVRRCVELGLGMTLVPSFSWQGQFSDKVALKKIGDYKRDTYIYTRKKGYHSLCARRFVELLKAVARD